jgi:hypothetical protein
MLATRRAVATAGFREADRLATLPLREVRRLHDAWADRQRADASTFGGPDGNLYFAEDAEFWEAVEAVARADR